MSFRDNHLRSQKLVQPQWTGTDFSNLTVLNLCALYQQNKRKINMMDSIAKANEWSTGHGCEAANNVFRTPVSVKAAKASKSSRLSKTNRHGHQTPISNSGWLVISCFDFVIVASLA